MIPKIIHYCWFGHNPKPEIALKCIASWRRVLPDYTIKEWNESNFDINCNAYVREAYEKQKWAFVSDYARFWILYHEGGLYFDTDVELIKPIDDILAKGPFMGCECAGGGADGKNSGRINCAPGLGLGVNPGLGLYKELMDHYECTHFTDEQNNMSEQTVVDITTGILREHGFQGSGTIECIDGIYLYPPEYFCPKNYYTGELKITENTRSIHHYMASWKSEEQNREHERMARFVRVFGKHRGEQLYGITSCIRKEGLPAYCAKRLKRIRKGKG